MKRQLAFSLVLATLSFIATKAIESYGVDHFYVYQATHFQKESGYFDLQHPVSIQYLPTGLIPLTEIASMDSLHLMAMQGSGLNGLVRLNSDSNSFSILSPLKSKHHLSAFVQVDSTLYLFDDRMDVYTSTFPYDSSSTRKISQERPNWKSTSACFHQATHRIYFNPEIDHPETNRLRAVYTYSLNKNRYVSEPLFSYDVDAVERFASEHGIRIHANRVTALKDTVFGLTVIPSAIAVHPKTNEVYILSAVDHSLVVFDQFGVITNYSELDAGLFPNPTGLTFAQNGDLLISNEDYIKNSIVRISWNKLWQSKGGKGLVFGR